MGKCIVGGVLMFLKVLRNKEVKEVIKILIKTSLIGSIFSLSFFLFINFSLVLDPNLRVSITKIFFDPKTYSLSLFQFSKTIVLVLLSGGSIGALVGISIFLINAKNILTKIICGIISGAIWGIISGFIIFRNYGEVLVWTLLLGIPWSLLIAILLKR